MTHEIDDEKLAKILRQVRTMLAIAEDERAPDGERDTARTRAEALMFKYRLDEATAVASGTSTVTPVWSEIEMDVADSEFASFYYSLAGTALRHVGARGRTSWHTREEDGKQVVNLIACGYRSDLNYMDMLLTAAMVEFGKRLEPRYDPNLSDRDNIYNMRSAGMERRRIAEIIYGGWETENEMKAKNRKVTAEFKKACAERGEDHEHLTGRGNSVKTYRESYANGFVQTFAQRLQRLRIQHGEEGRGLVLVDRNEKINEAFYLRFPQDRPSNKPYVDPRANCAKCKKASSGYCREHGYLRPSTRSYSGGRFNSAAYDRGGMAASMVDLGRGNKDRVNSASRPSLG